MSWQPRPITEREVPEFITLPYRVFDGRDPSPDEIERGRRETELDRTLAVFDEGQIVSTAGGIRIPLTVPGGHAVPAFAVTAVTVRHTHRRRGLLTAMMRGQLDDVRARGEPVAILYASEATIYERFGYGSGTFAAEIEVDRRRSAFRSPVSLEGQREVGPQEALGVLPRFVERLASRRPGLVVQPEAWWRSGLLDGERRGKRFIVLHERAQELEGYAIYHKELNWDQGSTLHVDALEAAADDVHAALWRHCLDVDLMARVKAWRPLDEPLGSLLVDRRAAKTAIHDQLWVRLVDVAAALAGRRYQEDGSLRLRVDDPFCAWNTGTYVVEGGPGGASCRRDGGEPDLALSATALGACYLGGNRFATLAAASLVEECAPGALARADAMFGTPVAPWCQVQF